MTTYAHDDLKRILDLHRKWLYGEEGGSRAVLTRADLTDADLTGAVLRGAVLRGADLTDADLTDADLTNAVLRDAVLRDADLTRADLTDADLTNAVLRDAVLRGAVLSDGVTWGAYLEQVVPALLCAGGKPLASVATPEHWSCNSWDNCPMAAAFDVHALDDVPLLYRDQARRFVQLYDAGLIPLPTLAS